MTTSHSLGGNLSLGWNADDYKLNTSLSLLVLRIDSFKKQLGDCYLKY